MNAIFIKRHRSRGFTLLEVLVVLAIIGIFMIVSYPSVLNTMAVRNLENATRRVQTTMQLTKNMAVNTKVVHRVRFYQPEGTYWAYDMERLESDGTWTVLGGARGRTIPRTFAVTITFPAAGADRQAVFSPLGTFPEFAPGQNSITLQSPKLKSLGQDDERELTVFMGGSVYYVKKKSA